MAPLCQQAPQPACPHPSTQAGITHEEEPGGRAPIGNRLQEGAGVQNCSPPGWDVAGIWSRCCFSASNGNSRLYSAKQNEAVSSFLISCSLEALMRVFKELRLVAVFIGKMKNMVSLTSAVERKALGDRGSLCF